MQTEFEAKAIKINKDVIRQKLKVIGATLVFPERKFTRGVFKTPDMISKRMWARVRDEGEGNITMSLKQIKDEKSVDGTLEILLKVDSFENAKNFLINLGIPLISFQENLREEWRIGELTIDIDTWPGIDPWVEVEGSSEESVQQMFSKLELDYSQAYFASADVVYREVYGMDVNVMPELKF